jgi:hypothetical protein
MADEIDYSNLVKQAETSWKRAGVGNELVSKLYL